MSLTLTQIETKVRYLVDDSAIAFIDLFTYSTSAVFTLTESNGITITTVLQNDVALDSSEYSYSSTTNKLTITATLTSGDTIEIRYTAYSNYSSTEVQNYVQAALIHISACNYYTWIVEDSTIYPEPSDKDESLIVMITSLLIEPDNKSYRLPDVNVIIPKDLPTIDKIRKTISVYKGNTHGIFGVL